MRKRWRLASIALTASIGLIGGCGSDESSGQAGGSSGAGGGSDAGADVRSDGSAHTGGSSGGSAQDGSAGASVMADAGEERAEDAAPEANQGEDVTEMDVSATADAGAPDAVAEAASSSDGAGDARGDGSDGTISDASDAAEAIPSCNDGNAATQDFYSATYGCGHKRDANPSDDQAWITYDTGFSVDVPTGLGWTLVSGSRRRRRSRSFVGATAACDGLSIAGLSAWRLPTIDEARSLAAGCPKTAPGGSCPISDANGYLSIDGSGYLTAACESCYGLAGPHAGGEYCKVDTTICAYFHTSSICTDCDPVKDWRYSAVNGNFFPGNEGDGIATVCVGAVPGGIP
jgi:hypothetical protein